MSKASTQTKSLKISGRTGKLYAERNRRLDHADVPQLSPELWAKGIVGKYYRPLKSQISFRIDNDVLAWLKSKGGGHLTRINEILRRQMDRDRH
jgi:uncharacterized protein (DUF4415 family)